MRSLLPWTAMSGPPCALSAATAPATSPLSRVELFHSTFSRAREATYFRAEFKVAAPESSTSLAVPPRSRRSSSLTRGLDFLWAGSVGLAARCRAEPELAVWGRPF